MSSNGSSSNGRSLYSDGSYGVLSCPYTSSSYGTPESKNVSVLFGIFCVPPKNVDGLDFINGLSLPVSEGVIDGMYTSVFIVVFPNELIKSKSN